MTIEKQLKHLILAQYKSLMAFANAAGVPYTTVDSMLKRGVMNAGVGKVVKICQCLGISADGLADGKIIPYETSEIKFSSVEEEFLRKYHALDERGKRAVDETLSREYDYSSRELTKEEVEAIFEEELEEVAKQQLQS